MKKIVALVAFGFVIASCGSTKSNDKQETVVSESPYESGELELLEPEVAQERPVYHATETVLTDLIHTKLEVSFDWKQSRMNGIATITAKPHFYPSDSLILDAKGMIINWVRMNGKDLKYTYADNLLKINLDKTYTRDQKYDVIIDYVARPEERETGGSAAILSDKGLYFINPLGKEKNKMPQIWTQGETEASSVWFPTIDSPNAKTTQEIFITVDDRYETLSNGKLISSRKTPEGMRVDHWKQDLPHSPYLFMMGVGEFKVVKDSYTRPDGSKMDVHYYVEPEWEEYAKDIFGETPEMIRFFSQKLGVEYPWDKYHQIVCRDYVSGAMENTGAVIFGDFVYKTKRELLDGNDQSTIAHELFHHWFGDLVTCESWSNLTLNESFANYSQYLWDEHRYGLDEADYMAEQEANGYFQSAQMQGYHDLVWFDYKDKEQMFDGHSYNKGGRILHMLRNYLGDEAFFEGIHRYLDENKFEAAEFHQLRLAFEEVCGEDLNWFFNQWYLGSAHPVLEFSHMADATGTVEVNVKQTQDLELSPIFKLPIQIAIYDNNGKHVHKVVIDELEESFTLPFSGELKGIVYDDQEMLLAKIKEDKTTDQYIYQFYNAKKYITRREGLLNGTKNKDDKAQQMILDAMKDPFWDIRKQGIKKTLLLKDARRDEGIAMMKKLAVNDPSSDVRAIAVSQLEKFLSEDELKALYNDRISNDQSYAVITASLKNYGKMDPEGAMKIAEPLEKERSSKMISGIAGLYAQNAGKEKYQFMEDALLGNVVQGFDKLGTLNSMTVYVSRQDAGIAEEALEVYRDQAKNGSFYMKMFMPQNLNYLIGQFGSKITALENEAKKEEDAGNPALADQARKQMKDIESIKKMYEALKAELDSESGH